MNACAQQGNYNIYNPKVCVGSTTTTGCATSSIYIMYIHKYQEYHEQTQHGGTKKRELVHLAASASNPNNNYRIMNTPLRDSSQDEVCLHKHTTTHPHTHTTRTTTAPRSGHRRFERARENITERQVFLPLSYSIELVGHYFNILLRQSVSVVGLIVERAVVSVSVPVAPTKVVVATALETNQPNFTVA